MAVQTATTLKGYFNTGDMPTEAQFTDLIDSSVNTGLLDETAHDLLDHTGLTGIPAAYSLPTASTTVLGGVKVDGTTVTITDGVISSSGSGTTNPMTAAGDIIIGGTSGAPTRLAKGTDGQVLTLASGLPSWATGGSAASIPAGCIVRSGATAPTGFLACDGSLLDTTTYADLYAAIGDTYSYQMNNGRPWQQQWMLNYTQSTDIQPWTTGTSLPGALYGSQSIVTNSRVYLLGGHNGSSTVSTVYTAAFSGGFNDYTGKSYIASAGTGQFRVPDTRWNDLTTPLLNSYIKA